MARIARRLFAYVLPYRSRLIWVAIAVLVGIGADLLLVQLLGSVVNAVGRDESVAARRDAVNIIGVVAVVTLLSRFVANWAEQYLTAWLGNRVVYALRDTMFRHLQRLSISYIDRRGVGAVMTRIQNDVAVINELFGDGVVGLGANLTVLLAIIVIMLMINWQLALLSFIVLPLMIAVVSGVAAVLGRYLSGHPADDRRGQCRSGREHRTACASCRHSGRRRTSTHTLTG